MPPIAPRPCRRPRILPCLNAILKSLSDPPTDVAMNTEFFQRRFWCAALLCLVALPGAALAQLKIEITSGVTDPVPIAIVPFASSGAADSGVDVAQIIQSDLEGSGRFKAMPRSAMTATPSHVQDVQLTTWKAAGNDYVVV